LQRITQPESGLSTRTLPSEVELSVGPEAQAVEVVPDEGEADGEARVDDRADVGRARAPGVFQLPEIGDAGEPDLALPREDAGGEPRRRRREVLRERGRVVDAAVPVAILEQAHALRRGQLRVLVAQELPVHRLAVRDGAAGQVVVHPSHVAADVEGAVAEAVRLDDVDAALLVKAEADGIDEVGLRGDEVELQPLGRAQPLDGLLGFGRGRLLGGEDRGEEKRREGAAENHDEKSSGEGLQDSPARTLCDVLQLIRAKPTRKRMAPESRVSYVRRPS
jgi:hypothetical protein